MLKNKLIFSLFFLIFVRTHAEIGFTDQGSNPKTTENNRILETNDQKNNESIIIISTKLFAHVELPKTSNLDIKKFKLKTGSCKINWIEKDGKKILNIDYGYVQPPMIGAPLEYNLKYYGTSISEDLLIDDMIKDHTIILDDEKKGIYQLLKIELDDKKQAVKKITATWHQGTRDEKPIEMPIIARYTCEPDFIGM